MATEAAMDAEALAGRVRAVQELLFGRTRGNQYRKQAAALMKESRDRLRQTAQGTRGALLNAVFEDYALAPLALARMARLREHAAMIFMALDLANLCLMNPETTADHHRWAQDIEGTRDSPVAMVLRCLEWLAG